LRRSRRTFTVIVGATVVAGICSTVSQWHVQASVPGDSAAIIVNSGTLTGVSVSSSPAGVTMQPAAFMSSTQDYALRTCNGKALTITLTGSGLHVGTQSGSSINVTLQLVSGQALIMSTPTAQYWFRCLPDDFPPITVVNHASTDSGWYVTAAIAPQSSNNAGLYPMILDSNGTPVWYMPTKPAIDFQQLSGTALSWAIFATGLTGLFHIYNYDTQTSITVPPAPTPHWSSPPPPEDIHELLRLSNGDYLLLGLPKTTDNSATFTDATGATHTNVNILDCVIEELKPSGALVWSWDAYYDHRISPSETFLGTSAPTGAYDVYHCNSLDIDPGASDPSQADILLSARNVDAIYRIHRTGGTVAWKLGDDHLTGAALAAAKATGNDKEPLLTSSYLTAENSIGGQHDARFQRGGAISFYDDHTGQATTTHGARGVQFNIVNTSSTHTASETSDFPAPDSNAAGTATGSYRPNHAGNGGAGDNVVGWGIRNTLSLTEFNNAGADLRDIYLNSSASATTGGFSTYRFVKLPPSAFSATLLRQASGWPRSALASVAAGWNHPRELTVPATFGNNGVINSDGVTLASPGNNVVATFWAGADGKLWNAWTSDGGVTFSTPNPLSSKPLGGSPHAVASNAGRIDVFWKGTDGQLWNDWHTIGTGWSGAQSLGGGGTMAGDPFPVAFGPNGLDVFWKGTDGTLWYTAYSASGGWQTPRSLGGGPLGSDPHPVSAGGLLDAFWKGADGTLRYNSFTSSSGWQGAKPLGSGTLASDPHPVSAASGVIDVVWRGTEDGLWDQRYTTTAGWKGAQLVGGAGHVLAPPVPVSPDNNLIDVFWRTTDPQSGSMPLNEAAYDPSAGWRIAPAPSNTSLTKDPTAVQTKPGHVVVFARSLGATYWFQSTSG